MNAVGMGPKSRRCRRNALSLCGLETFQVQL